ncbi:tRNA (guanine37-N1)-methyltransferase [Atopostipes suicloacalis DSM 15692]|uniref:tRNA (guanine-N(1)-)-methyltransferase n=1 Tax=Atopostipes suicloacalis DSM 15692 TaxID=1121025 RepID=A0A1M4UTP2_9LACT|nr:tRNA (guanosine(37)-N1)-methyltransferase TrmD [Atopostipes suicloacalis]SHE60106.1 tRNA (guanine37-N1)-methyltransferase [Atopostipes suicloacalis DSM 15692]
MKIDILTLFPEMFESPFNYSMVKRAIDGGQVEIQPINFRQYGVGKHQMVDDTPYGGGAGMLLKPEPIFEAIDEIDKQTSASKKRIILMDPAGKPFNQAMAEDFSKEEHLVFICGHYEGYDERIRTLVTDEVSLGDYVLTGGELAAMVMIDATVRLLPGVVGNEASVVEDSHSTGLLEHPHYTRPAVYKGMEVPAVLTSGHHGNIKEWRHKESLRRTLQRRPDLIDEMELTTKEQEWLDEFSAE